MSSSLVEIVASLVAGIGLGVCFFGGLWWTIRRLRVSSHPGALTILSLATRFVVLAVGIWLVMDGQLDRLLACAVGVLATRAFLVWRWGDRPAPIPVAKGKPA